MEAHSTCCIDFQRYPHNLPSKEISYRKLETYSKQLNEHSPRLFSDNACLTFWDLYHHSEGFTQHQIHSLEDVQIHCPLSTQQESYDGSQALECRFIFLHSINSRSPLFSTREMLMLVLSYHTVEPWFLDFLFPFGEQEEPHDFRLSSIRHRLYLRPDYNLRIPQLGRTGHELHLCYNLRAAETTNNKHMPWSVRQSVLYHSFDLSSGQAVFLILKGNESLCNEFKKETPKFQWKGTDHDLKVLNNFSSSLKTQLSFCWWSCDNWRLYLTYLEQTMKDITSPAVSEKVRARPAVTRDLEPKFEKPRRRATLPWTHQGQSHEGRAHNFQRLVRRTTKFSFSDESHSVEPSVAKPVLRVVEDERPCPYTEVEFSDLQVVQNFEEKGNEAFHALKGNVKVVKELVELYKTLPCSSVIMQQQCLWFCSQLRPIICDLEMHQSSLETLLKSFSERKSLLLSILEFQNMQASKYFAEKAQISADSMERMTEEMRGLARKTKDETVSMTVIAGVTMFFLPGTFVSTMMSTDIVRWNLTTSGGYELQAVPGARKLFLLLTLPLMFMTFVIWCFVSWHSRRHEHGVQKAKPETSTGRY